MDSSVPSRSSRFAASLLQLVYCIRERRQQHSSLLLQTICVDQNATLVLQTICVDQNATRMALRRYSKTLTDDTEATDIYKSHLGFECFSKLINPFTNFQIQTVAFQFLWPLLFFPKYADPNIFDDL
jgi:hypothetical protein